MSGSHLPEMSGINHPPDDGRRSLTWLRRYFTAPIPAASLRVAGNKLARNDSSTR